MPVDFLPPELLEHDDNDDNTIKRTQSYDFDHTSAQEIEAEREAAACPRIGKSSSTPQLHTTHMGMQFHNIFP